VCVIDSDPDPLRSGSKVNVRSGLVSASERERRGRIGFRISVLWIRNYFFRIRIWHL